MLFVANTCPETKLLLSESVFLGDQVYFLHRVFLCLTGGRAMWFWYLL